VNKHPENTISAEMDDFGILRPFWTVFWAVSANLSLKKTRYFQRVFVSPRLRYHKVDDHDVKTGCQNRLGRNEPGFVTRVGIMASWAKIELDSWCWTVPHGGQEISTWMLPRAMREFHWREIAQIAQICSFVQERENSSRPARNKPDFLNVFHHLAKRAVTYS